MRRNGRLRPVQVRAAHELVIDEIRRAVETWRFSPGDLLPTEREMAEMLGVARNTVRTAAAFLESDGFISVKRGRGGGYLVLDPALATDRGEDIRRDPNPVREAWEYRIIVESGAAELAALKHDDADLEAMSAILDDLDTAHERFVESEDLTTARAYQALDADFFFTMAATTRNLDVEEAVVDARRRLWIAYSSYLTRVSPDSLISRRRIFDAVVDSDPDRAGAETRRHALAGMQLFELWLSTGTLPDTGVAAPSGASGR